NWPSASTRCCSEPGFSDWRPRRRNSEILTAQRLREEAHLARALAHDRHEGFGLHDDHFVGRRRSFFARCAILTSALFLAFESGSTGEFLSELESCSRSLRTSDRQAQDSAISDSLQSSARTTELSNNEQSANEATTEFLTAFIYSFLCNRGYWRPPLRAPVEQLPCQPWPYLKC